VLYLYDVNVSAKSEVHVAARWLLYCICYQFTDLVVLTNASFKIKESVSSKFEDHLANYQAYFVSRLR